FVELVAPVGLERTVRPERDGGGHLRGEEAGEEWVRGGQPGLRCRPADHEGDVAACFLLDLDVGVGGDDRLRLATVGGLPVVFVLAAPVLRLVAVAVDVDDHPSTIRVRSGASAVSNPGRATSSAAAALRTGSRASWAGASSSALGAETDSASVGAWSVGSSTAMQVTPRFRSWSSML